MGGEAGGVFLVGCGEALPVIVPAQFESYGSLANVASDTLRTFNLGLIHQAWCLASSIQGTTIFTLPAVAPIGWVLLALQHPGVVAGNE